MTTNTTDGEQYATTTHPQTLAVTFADELGQSNDVADLASKIARAAFDAEFHSGPAPSSVAASSVYLAGRLIHGEAFPKDSKAPTQQDVAAVADVTPVTIRGYYHDLASVAAETGVAAQYDDQLQTILQQ